MKNPLITIVTVCYNSEKTIRDTIESVLNQTYTNIEYILVDGASKDNTVEIIKSYEEKFKDKGILYKWISEPDNGIYDAMNKGIDKANGEWINFMNSGDKYYKNTVISEVFRNFIDSSIDIIYGNHRVIYPHKTRKVKAGEINNIWKGSQFCHQSTFVSSKLHKYNKFNILNRIVADFEFFYLMYKKKQRFMHVNIVIADYSSGGFSDINRIDSILSRWLIINKNTKVNLYYLFIIINELLKQLIKKVIKNEKIEAS